MADTYSQATTNGLLAAKLDKSGGTMTGALEVPYINAKGATGGVAFHHRDALANSFQWYAEANQANLFSTVASANVAAADTSGNFKMNSGYGSLGIAYGCRAWVNFNGTGTVAIQASGNVSSITDLNVGNYQINLTNAMPDTNYAVIGTTGQVAAGGTASGVFAKRYDSPTQTTTVFGMYTLRSTDAVLVDYPFISAAFFR